MRVVFFIGCGAGFSRDHVGTWIVTLVASLAHGGRGFLRNEKCRRAACGTDAVSQAARLLVALEYKKAARRPDGFCVSPMGRTT